MNKGKEINVDNNGIEEQERLKEEVGLSKRDNFYFAVHVKNLLLQILLLLQKIIVVIVGLCCIFIKWLLLNIR